MKHKIKYITMGKKIGKLVSSFSNIKTENLLNVIPEGVIADQVRSPWCLDKISYNPILWEGLGRFESSFSEVDRKKIDHFLRKSNCLILLVQFNQEDTLSIVLTLLRIILQRNMAIKVVAITSYYDHAGKISIEAICFLQLLARIYPINLSEFTLDEWTDDYIGDSEGDFIMDMSGMLEDYIQELTLA